jgi:hypothetical protein
MGGQDHVHHLAPSNGINLWLQIKLPKCGMFRSLRGDFRKLSELAGEKNSRIFWGGKRNDKRGPTSMGTRVLSKNYFEIF